MSARRSQHTRRRRKPVQPGEGPLDHPPVFGHKFRAFTGLTPIRYVEVRRRFLREHPGHVLDSRPLPAD
jgi:hypothetical protein